MTFLGDGLLGERSVALAGAAGSQLHDVLGSLGARVVLLPGGLDDDGTEQWARSHAPLDGLLYDARVAFGSRGPQALRAAVDGAWTAVRGVATGALIPAEGPGKVVLVAPAADAGAHAQAARAALENLARTLSVEWARYAVTAVAIAPGPSTTEDQLATVCCFIASFAGDYFSGCVLELGAVAESRA
jgi:NAD(P)-dependent dehydrogenase (short-subunit alcohol dehydrogenase family)